MSLFYFITKIKVIGKKADRKMLLLIIARLHHFDKFYGKKKKKLSIFLRLILLKITQISLKTLNRTEIQTLEPKETK